MYSPIVTKDPAAVEAEVQSACREIFPDGDAQFVSRAFGWTKECFTGHFKDCQAIDAPYHDLEHTLQGTLCMARLLRGRHRAVAQPRISEHLFQLGIISILLHDTGYLKKRGDNEGTGAKYTITHVTRSTEFAAAFLGERGFGRDDVHAVQDMIRCTGIDAALSKIPFESEPEKIVGFALGTADLLGQMAADDYVEKLPVLYAEFAEAARFTNDKTNVVATFSSAEDLMRKTPGFWENYVRQKLDRDFVGLYRFLNDPYPDGPNFYLDRVEANIRKLRERIGTAVKL